MTMLNRMKTMSKTKRWKAKNDSDYAYGLYTILQMDWNLLMCTLYNISITLRIHLILFVMFFNVVLSQLGLPLLRWHYFWCDFFSCCFVEGVPSQKPPRDWYANRLSRDAFFFFCSLHNSMLQLLNVEKSVYHYILWWTYLRCWHYMQRQRHRNC